MYNIFNRNLYATMALMIILVVSSPIFAGCGSCEIQHESPKEKKASSLVTTIPKTGDIEGFVISSCGMCNFGYKKSKSCSLTIKIGDNVYPVEGTQMHNHGDPHSREGFCNAIRIAYASGKIKKNTFYSESFTLIESPN